VLRPAGLVAIAAIASIPLTFVVAMLLTPALWRLEAAVGMELAGHSGPSDWIFWTIFGLFTVVLSIILLRPTRSPAPDPSPVAGRDT
jgi:hypothetical protein